MMQVSLVLSTLDALISLGTLAVEQRLVMPEITEGTNVLIKGIHRLTRSALCTYLFDLCSRAGGRHLLQELTVDNFVPNDTYIDAAAHNVALISGPNTSGKSVYLKQVST